MTFRPLRGMNGGLAHGKNGRGPVDELRARIRSKGPITFAEFQTVALYWPDGGYYATRSPFGREGDFYTAPHLHPAFGVLLAQQLTEMWHLMGKPRPWRIVEMGAGSGRLATDVVESLEATTPGCASALQYLAVDVAGPPASLPGRVQWAQADSLPVSDFQGCVLANELLDALPVHRVTMHKGRLQELFVTLDRQGSFVEAMGEPSAPGLGERLDHLGVRLPEGYRAEINLVLEPWLRQAWEAMERGYLLIIDYGHEASTLYDGQRHRGTLRCYYRHTLNTDPYQHVGEQDISTHLDFTSVRQIAESLGFTICGYTLQAEFLANLGWAGYHRRVASWQGLTPWERRANLKALDTLVDPEGMGQFKVMALGKRVPPAALRGFTSPSSEDEALGRPGPEFTPLAGPRHLLWREARQPELRAPSWKELLS